MRRLALRALAPVLALALAAPAAAVLPGQILVQPAFATPQDRLLAWLYADAEIPCVAWRFAGRVGTTLAIAGERPASGCPQQTQAVALGELLQPGRYHVMARVAGDAEPLFAEAYFTVAENPNATVDPSEIALAPAQPTELDPLELVVSTLPVSCRMLVFPAAPTVDGDRIVIAAIAQAFPIPIPCTYQGTSGTIFRLPPQTAGLKTVELRLNGQPYLQRRLTVAPRPDHTRLGERFDAQLTWTDPGGSEHTATPVALSADSAYFWFFARDNVEVTLKLLDGTDVNGYFWLFAASMTDVPFRIDLADHGFCPGPPAEPPCPSRTYVSPAGNRNFIDTRAFGIPPP